jgi:hypothetical protein
MRHRPSGQIITFYSYKGGTGRTMAVANVAYLLTRPDSTQGQDTPTKVLGPRSAKLSRLGRAADVIQTHGRAPGRAARICASRSSLRSCAKKRSS